ncbi:hypothetical protein AXX17_ATUG01980 (chloroplast) [Arabidopsis thaliana]|uniref:Uncharacterized protein n=1 Tax=Arabidopsis thaliana TaxID=3702 RepID=A0A178U6L9_ARATH|nr:hypothetical protein AXX17_ATUG01980 [Arabidopsis thaliana]
MIESAFRVPYIRIPELFLRYLGSSKKQKYYFYGKYHLWVFQRPFSTEIPACGMNSFSCS